MFLPDAAHRIRPQRTHRNHPTQRRNHSALQKNKMQLSLQLHEWISPPAYFSHCHIPYGTVHYLADLDLPAKCRVILYILTFWLPHSASHRVASLLTVPRGLLHMIPEIYGSLNYPPVYFPFYRNLTFHSVLDQPKAPIFLCPIGLDMKCRNPETSGLHIIFILHWICFCSLQHRNSFSLLCWYCTDCGFL